MNKAELTDALAIANDKSVDLRDEEEPFDGFGLPDFLPVACTRRQVARLIRWQCFKMDGTIDNDNLTEIGEAGRKKFLIVG